MAELTQLSEKLDDIKERLVVIETKMEQYKGIDRTAHDAEAIATSAHKRIDKVEDHLNWVWRIVVGAVLLEIVRLVMMSKGVGA